MSFAGTMTTCPLRQTTIECPLRLWKMSASRTPSRAAAVNGSASCSSSSALIWPIDVMDLIVILDGLKETHWTTDNTDNADSTDAYIFQMRVIRVISVISG